MWFVSLVIFLIAVLVGYQVRRRKLASSGLSAPTNNARSAETVRGEDFPSGHPKTRISFRDEDPEGLARGWWENGRLQWEVTYRNGKRQGTLRFWYPDGQLESVRAYVDGQRQGEFVDYSPNGQKTAEGRYDHDALVESRTWNDAGIVEAP
jgi:hypothetical protein